MEIKTPIIPSEIKIVKVDAEHKLDKKAICMFVAIGFFLDQDTYFTDEKALPAATLNHFDDEGKLIESTAWFNWHYQPRDISFNKAVGEFSELFEHIIKEQSSEKNVILPLSGGLDSRTQATALKRIGAEVSAYSYQYKDGYPETKIAERIADACNMPFNALLIPKGYLWDKLNELATLNNCQTDFTLPRQMAVKDKIARLGNAFTLGHWGDVLFDNMGLKDLGYKDELGLIKKKLLKREGFNLAQKLWTSWSIEGDFAEYFNTRIDSLLKTIDISNTNAKLRAFKSLYWAPRWTSVNLGIFADLYPISLPYYDDRMCQFICTLPEKYLAGRAIQIEYIKKHSPELAAITWQDHRPYNLNNFKQNKIPNNLPYKLYQKVKRNAKGLLGQKYVQRNWEIQLLGKSNDENLMHILFNNKLENFVSQEIIDEVYNGFKSEPLKYSHQINMLVVLSKFNETMNDAE